MIAPSQPIYRRCSACGIKKPEHEFYESCQARCMECKREAVRNRNLLRRKLASDATPQPAMTLSAHYAGMVAHGLPDNGANRALVADGWDAALCAVQAAMFNPSGRLASSVEIAATLSRLHTWNEPKPATAESHD